VLVDAATRDDAAVVRLSADRALIATVDFFTPIVDDPGAWGAIAAANALSDVYAMGGRPMFCLNLVGWPREGPPFEVLGDVLAGAAEVMEAAGCLMLGGHSIDDPEPKVGFAVIGEAHPDRLLTNRGARAGDLLVLTKALGTGILTTALKRDRLAEADLAEAVASMRALNDTAAKLALEHGAHAATDVTGFGLLGHLRNLLAGAGVGATVAFDRLPQLERALPLAAEGVVPGGSRRNLEAADAEWDPSLAEAERVLCVDAQTSGGLLVALPAERAETLVAALRAAGVPRAAVVGRITDAPVLRVIRHADW
jgi:selenide, water dikinase